MPVESPPAAWHWGQFRADATRYAPRIAWDLLTDAQADCLYLNCYSQVTLSQRGIAICYHVSPPTVNVHVRRARAALRRVGRERAYQRLVADWQAAGRGRAGAGAAVGRASDGLSLSPAARQTGKPQASAL